MFHNLNVSDPWSFAQWYKCAGNILLTWEVGSVGVLLGVWIVVAIILITLKSGKSHHWIKIVRNRDGTSIIRLSAYLVESYVSDILAAAAYVVEGKQIAE